MTAVKDDEALKFKSTTQGRAVKVSVVESVNENNDQTTRVDEVSKTVSYVGYAQIGSSETSPVWKIKKITIVGSITSILYADGVSTYSKKWTDRATYTYS